MAPLSSLLTRASLTLCLLQHLATSMPLTSWHRNLTKPYDPPAPLSDQPPNPWLVQRGGTYITIETLNSLIPDRTMSYQVAQNVIGYAKACIETDMVTKGKGPVDRLMYFTAGGRTSPGITVIANPVHHFITYGELLDVCAAFEEWLSLWTPGSRVWKAKFEISVPWDSRNSDIGYFGLDHYYPQPSLGNVNGDVNRTGVFIAAEGINGTEAFNSTGEVNPKVQHLVGVS